jgi:uncharacterized protein YggE
MRLLVLLLAAAAAAFGQLDDNTLVVTATRTVSLPPDRAAISINLSTPVAASIDDAIATLQGTGIVAADLSGVNGSGETLLWSFGKTVPFTQMKNSLAALAGIQSSLAQKKSALSLNYYVSGQVSTEAQNAAALCPMTTLVADARTQAQRVADAAVVKVGPVISMTQGAAGGVAAPVFLGAIRQAAFILSLSQQSQTAGTSCQITVEYKLLR